MRTKTMHYSVTDLLALFDSPLTEGSFNGFIEGIESLSQAKTGQLSFLTVPRYVPSPKYKAQVASSDASIILLPQDYKDSTPKDNQLYIRVANTSLALAKLCKQVENALFPKPKALVHPSAIVAPSAQIDPTAHIGPLCVVEENAKIGRHTVLVSQVYVGPNAIIGDHSHVMPHVSIYGYCEIGSRVRLHSGCVIGSDGYGYEFSNGTHQKVPQIGIVIIEDDVEIGANTTIDRARFGKTIIGQGSKIDNLVQVAHNVIIGKHCLLVSQVGVSGSTKLEDYVVAGGQVGFAGHLTIGKGTQIGAQSGIHTDLKPGSKVLGSPAHPFMQSLKIEALKKELPDLFKRVKTLEKKLPPPHINQ